MYSLEAGQAACGALLDAGRRPSSAPATRSPSAPSGPPAGRADVPGDVSVVGYDDSALMKYTDPPLTTVRQPIETMGRAAVDLLVSQIEGRHDGPGRAAVRARAGRARSTGPGELRPEPAVRLHQGLSNLALHSCESSA